MTIPVSHGFPDWGRQVAASDIEVIYLDTENIALQTIYPSTDSFFVGAMPYLRVEQSAGAVRSQTTVRWWADTAQTKSLGADFVITPANGSAAQCVPVRGPYVSFVVDLSAYPNDHNLQVFMTPVPFAGISGPAGNNMLITVNGTAVAAGITNTANATVVRGGWAYWQGVFDAGTLGLISLLSVDFNNTARLLDVMGPTLSTQGREVFLPALPVRITAFNGDGVARNLYASVLHRPFNL